MEQYQMKKLLESVRDGVLSPDEALLRIREAPYTDLGYARIDNHRQIRQGFAEVIYGEGKTSEQILGIVRNMYDGGVKTILVTRLS
jgi:NCAIR mutase (PurE)-related protein